MFNQLLFHRVQVALVIEMVDTREEVGFHFLSEVAELHLHARVPDMPAHHLLLKWTPVNLV